MSTTFERYKRCLVGDDQNSFEALCFHRADERPDAYAVLLSAPRMNDRDHVASLVALASMQSKQAVDAAYKTEDQSGAEPFAYTLASLCEGPGCIPQLISVMGPDLKFDLFDCNIAQERGGPLDSTFTEPYACGLVWNSFHFFEDVIGKGSSVSLSLDHLTELGVEYAEWLFADRISVMRARSGRG